MDSEANLVLAIAPPGVAGTAKSRWGLNNTRTCSPQARDAMRNDKTKILAAGLLVACAVAQAMRPAIAAHATIHYWPLVKDAKAGNRQAAQRVLQAARNSAGSGFPANASVEYYAGLLYNKGWGVSKNQYKAVYWYKKAAAQGNADAEFHLGFGYWSGEGVHKSYVKAAYWWQKAAAQGLAAAENNLGFEYQHGKGMPRSYPLAVYWYGKAASQGDAAAENNLAYLRNGVGHSAGNAGTPARRSDSVERFTTYCNNASCVRRYSNGTSVHFTACINPADGQPMLNAPIRNGVGSCSGTDSDGNIYGTGSFQ